jgi:glycosidase
LQACSGVLNKNEKMQEQPAKHEHLLSEEVKDNKLIVYQIFTRLFGNANETNKKFGTAEENGVGKFNDINDVALQAIKDLGITHIWYTGIIEHAVVADYTNYGIILDDADVVKGRAGSPYAIKDYYDVNPDLAVDVPNRMLEFEALLERTHQHGMKVIIDFVPNHVARLYQSDAKPAGTKDLGEDDDQSVAFHPDNNFYYLPGESFKVPEGYTPLNGYDFKTKDGKFDEFPAKATGNDAFKAQPDINDWFETVKLNYGIDIQNNYQKYFGPVPSTWEKMHDILVYWTNKGVDGFRCDMAEMVPVEFWAWAIPRIKEVNPDVIFIAEIYNPNEYRNYIHTGKFDYLYDKVGLYDTLKSIMQGHGDATRITGDWKTIEGINNHMLRFLENHDEQRIASPYFAGNPNSAIPGMTISATLASGPVMIYFGQEVGETGAGEAGFSGDDGRTTIFDYWGVPAHQQWMNGGKFDGERLNDAQKELREFYKRLLNNCMQQEAIRKGHLFDLQPFNVWGKSRNYNEKMIYSYLRFTENQRLLMVINFDQHNSYETVVKIPQAAWSAMGVEIEKELIGKDILGCHQEISFSASEVAEEQNHEAGVRVILEPLSAYIFELG